MLYTRELDIECEARAFARLGLLYTKVLKV